MLGYQDSYICKGSHQEHDKDNGQLHDEDCSGFTRLYSCPRTRIVTVAARSFDQKSLQRPAHEIGQKGGKR